MNITYLRTVLAALGYFSYLSPALYIQLCEKAYKSLFQPQCSNVNTIVLNKKTCTQELGLTNYNLFASHMVYL